MSDYKHEKVVRLPFPEEDFKTNDPNDDSDRDEYLSKISGDLYEVNGKNSFQLGYSDEGYYIDWCYYSTYGEESGDYGNARLLTEKELEVIKPYFDKIGVKYKDEELRVVDYCYYNGCEPPDYYEIANEDTDHSKLFIN